MAAEQLSTAIKEEWSLTEEQVALIEASTTLCDKPDCVGMNTVTIFVPTPALLGRAQKFVADWKIEQPSNGELHGGAIGPGLNAKQILGGLIELIKVLRAREGLASTALRLQRLVVDFVCGHIANPVEDFEIWDVISISKGDLRLSKNVIPMAHSDEIYGHIQLALAYYPPHKSFACVYSYVYRSNDELTDAIRDSSTTERTNSIRILYANLMANYIRVQRPQSVKLVPSDIPYPVLRY